MSVAYSMYNFKTRNTQSFQDELLEIETQGPPKFYWAQFKGSQNEWNFRNQSAWLNLDMFTEFLNKTDPAHQKLDPLVKGTIQNIPFLKVDEKAPEHFYAYSTRLDFGENFPHRLYILSVDLNQSESFRADTLDNVSYCVYDQIAEAKRQKNELSQDDTDMTIMKYKRVDYQTPFTHEISDVTLFNKKDYFHLADIISDTDV